MFIDPKKRIKSRGFTLVEVLIGCALGGMALALVMGASFYTGRSMASLTDSVNLGGQSRSVIDLMSQKIRQAERVTAFSSNSITVTISGANLTYQFIPRDRALLEIENNTTNKVLENCKSLQFELYRRNPITNSFNQFSADNNIAEAKLVRVSWTCETERLGKSDGASELVSSKIVLRSR
ncbi:MAG TPA: prepilin-type N-terminal cleavage/methylation domain-containing protein [Candidatus Kapabacteria bacterium]|nr:prepilin-type N-terminal cleavage/methylation domain-containing protein [Candidatus Kapabacteria bacterium]